MRNFFITLVAALATIMSVTSCNDTDKEGTYNFFRNNQYYATQHAAIDQYIANTDPYLAPGNKNERTGKYSEVCSLEIDYFITRCNNLDSDYIKSQLGLDEYYQINLFVYNPLARLVSVRWTNNGLDTISE